MSLSSQLVLFAQRVAAENKAIRTLVNGNVADLSALTTTAKGNLVLAVNEVNGRTTNNAVINDTTASTTSVYSSTKTNSAISTAVSNLVNSAPTVLDTLSEIDAALNNDPNFAATMTTALGLRLRFDAAQTLTGAQQTQGQANLSVYSQTQIGDPTTDFAAAFVAALP